MTDSTIQYAAIIRDPLVNQNNNNTEVSEEELDLNYIHPLLRTRCSRFLIDLRRCMRNNWYQRGPCDELQKLYNDCMRKCKR